MEAGGLDVIPEAESAERRCQTAVTDKIKSIIASLQHKGGASARLLTRHCLLCIYIYIYICQADPAGYYEPIALCSFQA